ncbi:MAG: class I SAM-dependent methyltransferase [Anaerolineae bacterium]
MDPFLKSNQELWNAWTRIHVQSPFYDVAGFKAGQNRLDSIVRGGVGDVRGKSLLHLQCHFGLDTLNWARLGAQVTGLDFSDAAITQARALSAELNLPAEFICANLYDAPQVLAGQFDIVFTSYGAIYWLPDLAAWGQVIAHFLKPGGLFFIAEAHPFAYVFDDDHPTDLQVRYPYFNTVTPLEFPVKGSYADPQADYQGIEYGWQHSMSEIIGGLTGAGLHVQTLREYPYLSWRMFKFMEQDAEGWWRLPDRFPSFPLLFSLTATRPLP